MTQMKSEPDEIIDKISEIRQENNDNWMDLLKIAMKYAPPEEMTNLLYRINVADRRINELWASLRQHSKAANPPSSSR